MKIGVRKPNLKKAIKARTTVKLKRAVKKSVNPLYGKKGMGLATDPKKAVYNKVYNKTTIGVSDIVETTIKSTRKKKPSNPENTFLKILIKILGILLIIIGLPFFPVGLIFVIPGILCLLPIKNKKEVEE